MSWKTLNFTKNILSILFYETIYAVIYMKNDVSLQIWLKRLKINETAEHNSSNISIDFIVMLSPMSFIPYT